MSKLIKIWCWVVGHDIICMKRHEHVMEYNELLTTTSAFKCLRCQSQWQEQWDE